MAKKDKKKKGLGAEKTQAKQAKKQAKALLKEGEESIDAIIASIKKADKKLIQTLVIKQLEIGESPSPRSNASLIAHPHKPQLWLFGGEFYDGRNTTCYNELYCYDLSKGTWRMISAPGCPTPRSAHQSVVYERDGTRMLTFGGEFTSPSGAQFHHFKDLYSLSLDGPSHEWSTLTSINSGPSARSGHRMLLYKNQYLIVFGGYFDNGNTTQYHNDLYVLDLSSMSWRCVNSEKPSEYDSTSRWPAARSGFAFWLDEEKDVAYVYGGMTIERPQATHQTKKSKSGKSMNVQVSQAEREVIHTDLWSLSLTSWNWSQIKKRGVCPSARVGMAAASISTGGKRRGLCFGGVADVKLTNQDKSVDEDLDDSRADLFNDTFTFNFDTTQFHAYTVKGMINTAVQVTGAKKKDKKTNEKEETVSEEPTSVFDFNPVKEAIEEQSVNQSINQPINQSTVVVAQSISQSTVPVPAPRRSALLCIRENTCYLYGGVSELENEREHIFADVWSIELGKDSWQQLVADREDEVWIESESDGEEDDSEDEKDEKHQDSEDEQDEDQSINQSINQSDPLLIQGDETQATYFARTKDHWLTQATCQLEDGANDKLLRKRAFELAQEKYDEQEADEDDQEDD